jgi:hypothetical protein
MDLHEVRKKLRTSCRKLMISQAVFASPAALNIPSQAAFRAWVSAAQSSATSAVLFGDLGVVQAFLGISSPHIARRGCARLLYRWFL